MTLQDQQTLLLTALFDPWGRVQANLDVALHQSWPQRQYLRGLQAYRSNAATMAHTVLLAAYPQVARLLGATQFEGLAVHLWRTQPPTRGDLAQWGEGLANSLRGSAALMDNEPYLPDLAELEWALHAAKTAPDSVGDDAVPLAVIDSDFAIVDVHGGKAWEDIQGQPGQRALVYRVGFKTACISIPKDAQL